ncbi:MAG: energy-coupling factor transporter ATPase [Lachnospiraceae bacterium]|jgi:energy-coupling factor transport system ATP-binding protein|nr:energy-coupling factor transporter ATPase [Lachnospiraceae bacterium]
MIRAEGVSYDYVKRDEQGKVIGVSRAIDSVDFEVNAGEFVAILGANGSGKSTLARQINALLVPTKGTVWVDGKDTKNEKLLWEIRQCAGMVFQNPDNQIIGSIVEEDVAFGPENIGIPTEEIWTRVDESLNSVKMIGERDKSPNHLSGGQKQRVAIAGVLAMEPKCIVLDEPTAMLDPIGRKEVLMTVRTLQKEKNVTVLLITHFMEEATCADKILVMNEGKIVLAGSPKEVFSHAADMKNWHLDVPQVTLVAEALKEYGIILPDNIIEINELAEALC